MLIFYMSFIDDEKDKSKFEIIYYEYRKRMYDVAYSILNNKEDAEDTVHNTFISIARNMKAIDEPISVKTLSYVLKATKNTALNLINKNKREMVISIDNIEDIPDKEFMERLHIQLELNNLINAIMGLDDKYKDVLYLHFVMGMTINEVASLLNRKKSTVKQQLVRGKKLLINSLKDENND